MRIPSLPADFAHARPCKLFCEKYLTLPILQKEFLGPERERGRFEGKADNFLKGEGKVFAFVRECKGA